MAKIQIYDTKQALSCGIVCREVDQRDMSERMVTYRNSNGYTEYLHGEGKDWHRTWDSALQRAESMRVKRIKSLERSLKRMQGLVFEYPSMRTDKGDE